MGMTNGQFKSYVRLLLQLLDDVKAGSDREAILKKIEEIQGILQSALED